MHVHRQTAPGERRLAAEYGADASRVRGQRGPRVGLHLLPRLCGDLVNERLEDGAATGHIVIDQRGLYVADLADEAAARSDAADGGSEVGELVACSTDGEDRKSVV